MKDLTILVDFLISNKNIKLSVSTNNDNLITDIIGINIDSNGIANLIQIGNKDIISVNVNHITNVSVIVM